MWNGSHRIEMYSHLHKVWHKCSWMVGRAPQCFYVGLLHCLGFMLISRKKRRGEKVYPLLTHLNPKEHAQILLPVHWLKTQPQSWGRLGKAIWLSAQEEEEMDLVTNTLVMTSSLALTMPTTQWLNQWQCICRPHTVVSRTEILIC